MTDKVDALLERAIAAAAASPNKIRKVGAVLVAAGTEITGCNAFPPGIEPLAERTAGENRFIWLEHAERTAIFEAARRGLATDGATLLSTYFPCTDCARALVLAGIRTVATPRPEFDDPVWGESFRTSATILAEGAVEGILLTEDQAEIHRRIWARAEERRTPSPPTPGTSAP